MNQHRRKRHSATIIEGVVQGPRRHIVRLLLHEGQRAMKFTGESLGMAVAGVVIIAVGFFLRRHGAAFDRNMKNAPNVIFGQRLADHVARNARPGAAAIMGLIFIASGIFSILLSPIAWKL